MFEKLLKKKEAGSVKPWCGKTNVSVAVCGLGTIGCGVVELLAKNAALIQERTGVLLSIGGAADLDLTRSRDVDLAPYRAETDALALAREPSIDIVVELIGGTDFAGTLVKEALANGKQVVTANKALLSTKGAELFALAREKGVDLFFEASVCGGIPIIKALREGFAGNRLQRICGIVNGTCNYILTRMQRDALSFEDALKEAQEKGYAEANPSLDVDGWDAAHKALILTAVAFGASCRIEDIIVEGISKITPDDIRYADQFGFRIKLLAVAEATEGGHSVFVAPCLIPEETPLASVEGGFNAVEVVGDFVGESMFYGLGAGRRATASAVASDIIDAAVNIVAGASGKRFAARNASLVPAVLATDRQSRFYLRVMAIDKPGVLAKIAATLGAHEISITHVIQKEVRRNGAVPVVMLLDRAFEKNMYGAVHEIAGLESIVGEPILLRIEETP